MDTNTKTNESLDGWNGWKRDLELEKRREASLEQFIDGRFSMDSFVTYLATELFNPYNPSVDDEFVEMLLDTGGKDGKEAGENSFWVNGGKLLKFRNALPPKGFYDGELWVTVSDLNKMMKKDKEKEEKKD